MAAQGSKTDVKATAPKSGLAAGTLQSAMPPHDCTTIDEQNPAFAEHIAPPGAPGAPPTLAPLSLPTGLQDVTQLTSQQIQVAEFPTLLHQSSKSSVNSVLEKGGGDTELPPSQFKMNAEMRRDEEHMATLQDENRNDCIGCLVCTCCPCLCVFNVICCPCITSYYWTTEGRIQIFFNPKI